MSSCRCIDRCVNRKSLNASGNISIGYRYIVSKEDFSEQEWSQAYLVYDFDTRRIRKECEEAIENYTLCNEIKFEQGIPVSSPKQNMISLEVYYGLVLSVEEQPDWNKLLMDILSAQSILFGLNVLKVLMTAYRWSVQFVIKLEAQLRSRFESRFGYRFGFGSRFWSRFRFRFRSSQSRSSRTRSSRSTDEHAPKKVPPLIYLFCIFGFSYYAYRLFDPLLNGQLTYSQHHKLAKQISMPEIVLCFQINTSLIDTNRTLTGHYLDELTAQMRPESIFKNISYLNGSDWVTLKSLRNFKRTVDFKIITFFFLDCKCFR